MQPYIFAPLRKKRLVKYPNFMRPGDKLRIVSIHPNDSHYSVAKNYLGKVFVLAETPQNKLFSRTEAPSTNPSTRTFVATNVDLGNGKIEYFTAIKIERAFVVDNYFQKLKGG